MDDHLSPPPTGVATLPKPQPPPNSELAHQIFFGGDGLRAGWSLLLFSALFSLLLLLVGINPLDLFDRTSHSAGPIILSAASIALSDGLLFSAVFVATFLMSRIERRPLRSYGLGRSPQALVQLLSGLLSGITVVSALIGALSVLHLLVFTGHLPPSAVLAAQAADYAFSFLLVALFEEYFLRGYLQFTLSRGLSGMLRPVVGFDLSRAIAFWTSAAALSFLFGLGHASNPGESPLGLLSAGLIGLIFCLSLWRTGSLWWALGFHTAWDWAQSFLYGVPDSGTLIRVHLLNSHPRGSSLFSGGTTGPEGSAYILPTIAFTTALVLLTLRRNGWPIAGSRISTDVPAAEPGFTVLP